MKATERLFLIWDKKQVVPESNPDATFLLCNPGEEIPEDVAKLLKKQQQSSQNESVRFQLWDDDESLGSPGRPMVRCGHCGKESPLSLQCADPVNPPWARVPLTEYRCQAESEFPASIEELAAKAVLEAKRRVSSECVARRDQAHAKLAKVVGERTEMGKDGNVRTVRRDGLLGEKKESLLRLAQNEIDQAAFEEDKARRAYERLQQPRRRKIEARVDELQFRPSPGYKAPPRLIIDEWGNKVFADQSAALREVIGDGKPAPTESAPQPTDGKDADLRKARTPGEELETHSDDQLREIAEKLEVKIPKGGREALILAVLRKVGYDREAEEREAKPAAVRKG